MSVTMIHHIQLAMPPDEEARAVAFYEELLDLPRVPKPPFLAVRGGCWFESGTVRIHLGVEDDFRPARKAHPALLLEDLEEMRERLLAGAVVTEDQPLPGYARFYVDDPFGNRIEILQSA